MPGSLRRYLGRNAGLLTFLVTVLAAYASSRGRPDSPLHGPLAAPLYLLGLAYLLVGWLALPRIGPPASIWVTLLYFLVEGAIATAILYWSGLSGFMPLVLFPLASNGLEMLPRRLAAPAWRALFGIFVSVRASLYGWLDVPRNAPIIAAGIVFVGGFTYFAISERAARAEVERLAAELQAANQKLREHAAQVEELATAKERNRLPREIHDHPAPNLTIINVQLEAAQVLVPADPERARAALG